MTGEHIRTTIDYAIDLGTSDSVIAYNDADDVCIIENYQTNELFTPSAVWIDKDNNIQVGQSARDALITDTENAYSEFKLTMGFPIKYHFKRSDNEYKPEELSSEILKNLKKSAYKKTGQTIDEIIITIPANSNELNIKATRKAAKLAGFKKTYFILEPVAAAMAYGLDATSTKEKIWMVYDLGGGTFDICLVRFDGKDIKRIADSGIDNIGGVTFDWKIVNEIFKEKIISERGLDDFDRSNPQYRQQFYRLKHAAEEAKKKLSYEDEVDINIENLFDDDYCFDYTLTRQEVEELIWPFIMTTIETCNNLLWQLSLSKKDIEKIILVGGATHTPLVRRTLKKVYEIPIENSLNPLTVVARGAAVYASTIAKTLPEINEKLLTLIIGKEEIIDNDKIRVNGRVFSDDSYISYNDLQVKVFDNDNVITSKFLDEDGTFQVAIPADDTSEYYHVDVFDKNDKKMTVDGRLPNTIHCRKNMQSTKKMPMTIQLLLHDNKTLTLAKKGENLKYTSQICVYTTKKLSPENDDSIHIPIYCGENRNATDNDFLGQIEIKQKEINEELKVNSKIILNLEIDDKENILFKIYLPQIDKSLTKTFKYNNETPSIKKLDKNHRLLVKRFGNYDNTNINDVSGQLKIIKDTEELEYLKLLLRIARQDENCIKTTQEYINHINMQLDDVEEKIEINTLKENIEDKLIKLEKLSCGYEDEIKIGKFINEYELLKKDRNQEINMFKKLYMKILEFYINQNTIETMKSLFEHLKKDIDYTKSQEKIEDLLSDSEDAIDISDKKRLVRNIIELYYLKNSTDSTSDVIADIP